MSYTLIVTEKPSAAKSIADALADDKPTKVGEKAFWYEFTKDGKAFDIFNPSCTHLGCPYNWNENKREFFCPCHNGVFSMEGEVLSGPPPRPLDRYPNRIENGKLWVFPTTKKEKA